MILLGLANFKLAGKFLKHALGLLILCWRRMLRAAGAAALIGVISTEVLACLAAGQFPPPLLAQLVAAALALALAYAVALTVLLAELFAGTLDTIRLLMGDVEAGARAASATVEHEAGNIRDSLRHLVGLRTKPPIAASTVAAVTLSKLAARTGRGRTPAVSPSKAPAVDVDLVPPRPRTLTARPVPASQLPRIAWTYDEPIQASPPLDEPPPPLPMKPVLPAEEIAPVTTRTTLQEEKLDLLARMDEDTLKRRITSGKAAAKLSSEPGEIARESERIQPRSIEPRGGSATRPLGSTTRPLGRVTRPLTDSSRLRETTNSGGLWERLSHALVGPIEEPAEPSESETPSTSLNAGVSPEEEHNS
jgi:hypothetical protein